MFLCGIFSASTRPVVVEQLGSAGSGSTGAEITPAPETHAGDTSAHVSSTYIPIDGCASTKRDSYSDIFEALARMLVKLRSGSTIVERIRSSESLFTCLLQPIPRLEVDCETSIKKLEGARATGVPGRVGTGNKAPEDLLSDRCF